MSKASELSRLWNLILQCDRELSRESKSCQQGPSKHYSKLSEDMLKLKTEYEKVKGGGSYDPNNVDHGERMTRNKVIGDLTGKTGLDSHGRLE